MQHAVNGPAPYERMVVILADGARPDVMSSLAAAGEMPAFRRHFVDAGGFREATSVFPTVSGPAHLPVLTGVHPGHANLPGIRWAERPGKFGFWGHTRSYMSLFRQMKLARDIPPDVQTLFHHVTGIADINTWFVRGCPFKARRTRFSKANAFAKSLVSKDWYASDTQAESAMTKALLSGFPSAFAVFPAIDEMGHRVGPMVDATFEAYRRLDKSIERIVDTLVKLGTYDKTLMMITSDHGQSSTHTHLELSAFVEKEIPKTLSYPKIWRNALGAEAAVMVSGNSMANIYLKGSGGWRGTPELADSSSRGGELLRLLTTHPAIDHIVYKTSDVDFCVDGAKGRARITHNPARDPSEADTLTYTIEGEDPFASGLSSGSTLSADECLHRTYQGAYPDAPWQVVQFFRARRAGDLVVCARSGFDLREKFEYQPHLGSHGCLSREHMMVPAAINGKWQATELRSVDLFASLLQATGRPVPEGIDGVARTIVRS